MGGGAAACCLFAAPVVCGRGGPGGGGAGGEGVDTGFRLGLQAERGGTGVSAVIVFQISETQTTL